VSFRRRMNRHDAWVKHREESAAQFAEIGLPIAVYDSEQTLAEFLTSGPRTGAMTPCEPNTGVRPRPVNGGPLSASGTR